MAYTFFTSLGRMMPSHLAFPFKLPPHHYYQNIYDIKPFFEIEQTLCYGSCPSYSIKVYPNGKLEYDGKEYVKVKGKYVEQLSDFQLQNLTSLLEESNFTSLRGPFDCYDVTDHPSTIITYNGRKINHYAGCRGGAGPDLPKLVELEKKLLQLLRVDRFIGNNGRQ